jgi:hypothetical protein
MAVNRRASQLPYWSDVFGTMLRSGKRRKEERQSTERVYIARLSMGQPRLGLGCIGRTKAFKLLLGWMGKGRELYRNKDAQRAWHISAPTL